MRCVDLFSGCGGMSLGFQKADFEIVASMDNWTAAIDVYKENFKHLAYAFDLSESSAASKIVARHNPDIIVGGPPCQDFSSAGKRDVSLGRADLTYAYQEIICEVKPKFFVMENVELITKSPILRDVIESFRDTRYGLTAVILDASYCNVPQKRNRFFLIGHLDCENNFLIGTLIKNLTKKPMTLRDYFGDELPLAYYYRHPRNYNRRGIFSIDEPSPTVRGVNRPIPLGYTPNSCDPSGVTLTQVRPLTTEERARIQTFPKNFKWIGTKTAKEQMIGNAVPVNLAKFVGDAILEFQRDGIVYPFGQADMFSKNVQLPTTTLNRVRDNL